MSNISNCLYFPQYGVGGTVLAWTRNFLDEKKAIMQRGSIEHEQIIYVSSNRRMKQLMDWLGLSVDLTASPLVISCSG